MVTRRISWTKPLRNKKKRQDEPTLKGYCSIPYIRGVSERIKRIHADSNIRTAYKPMMILGDVFRKPKDRRAS